MTVERNFKILLSQSHKTNQNYSANNSLIQSRFVYIMGFFDHFKIVYITLCLSLNWQKCSEFNKLRD